MNELGLAAVTALYLGALGCTLPSPPVVDETTAHLKPVGGPRSGGFRLPGRQARACLRALRAWFDVQAPAEMVAAARRWLSEHVIDVFTDRASYHLGGRRHEVVRTVLILRGRP